MIRDDKYNNVENMDIQGLYCMQNRSEYSNMFVLNTCKSRFCGNPFCIQWNINGRKHLNFTKQCRTRKFSTHSGFSGCQGPFPGSPSMFVGTPAVWYLRFLYVFDFVDSAFEDKNDVKW